MILALIIIGVFVLLGIIFWQALGKERDVAKIIADGEVRKSICTIELDARIKIAKPYGDLQAVAAANMARDGGMSVGPQGLS